MVPDYVRDYVFPSGFKHNLIGNSWKVTDEGEWYLPEHTLGWGFIEFASRYFLNQMGDPFVLTDEQLRLALWLYALNEDGSFQTREAVIQRMKGHGKDPLAMAIALFEAFGRCRFSHWDDDGEPVGRPHPSPRVALAAVSEGQAKETMRVARWMVSSALRQDYGVDMGQVAITGLQGRAQIDLISASFRSAEGKPISFAIYNETHHWVPGNNGTELYDTLEGNVAKGGHGMSRRLHITNAYMPGEDSVAERTRRAYEDQVARNVSTGKAVGIYYDSLEADYSASLDADTARVIIPEVRGDSVWLDPESIIEGFILKTSISPARSRRMQYNQINTSADALFEKGDLDACVDRLPLRKNEPVTLGFDGARRRDSTALIACRVSDRKIFTLKVWEKPDKAVDDDWRLSSEDVDSAVQEAFASYQVVAFYADVHLWESEISAWSDQFRDQLVVRASPNSTVGYDMRGQLKKTTMANEAVVAAVQQKAFKFDGDLTLTRHLLNVMRRHNNFGVSFGKESRESAKKIDAYAATLLAFMAANDVAERGKLPEPKKSRRLLRRR